ncbi:phage terminase small subunit P27 family [Ahrensia marina]|uniref:Terminase n=1 Tax=Ahrensia marina TaxID=1514904 RepID=A0A0N0VL68_9HYPH|nr:phage terminase small subunit P27 family [Ahrensia marina]KPA99973.1 terminase [Ahrensia marina]
MRGTKPHLVVDNGAVKRSPPAPSWLSLEAKKEWKRVINLLVDRRILTRADLASLENYCTAIGQVRDCEKHLQENGHVIDVDGVMKRNPSVGIQSDAMTRARLLAAELGLTPVSRSRPTIRDQEDDDSLLD